MSFMSSSGNDHFTFVSNIHFGTQILFPKIHIELLIYPKQVQKLLGYITRCYNSPLLIRISSSKFILCALSVLCQVFYFHIFYILTFLKLSFHFYSICRVYINSLLSIHNTRTSTSKAKTFLYVSMSIFSLLYSI